MQHAGVGEAAAALIDEGHPRIVGYVVPRGAMPEAAALRRHLGERLPEYMVPSAFVELASLPLGATGKLDRTALPAPARENATSHDAPQTQAERVLAPIWEWDRDSAHLLVDIFAEDIGVRHDDLRGQSLDAQLDLITSRAIAAGLFPQGFSPAMARRAWDVFQTHRRAERRYAGGPLAGDLLLVTSDSRLHDADPALGWTRFADRVVRRAVSGNHQQILRAPSVDALAGHLRVLLSK